MQMTSVSEHPFKDLRHVQVMRQPTCEMGPCTIEGPKSP